MNIRDKVAGDNVCEGANFASVVSTLTSRLVKLYGIRLLFKHPLQLFCMFATASFCVDFEKSVGLIQHFYFTVCCRPPKSYYVIKKQYNLHIFRNCRFFADSLRVVFSPLVLVSSVGLNILLRILFYKLMGSFYRLCD